MKKFAIMVLFAGTAVICGCAPSAQTVKLEPDVKVAEQRLSGAVDLALRVVDRRPSQLLGYRDEQRGVALTTEGDLAEVVRSNLHDALVSQGIEVLAWDSDAERRLEVNINSFSYQRSGGFLRRQVRIHTDWEITGSINGKRYESRASASTQEQMPFGPSAQDNQEMINRVLSRGIEQVATESKLLKLLEDRG